MPAGSNSDDIAGAGLRADARLDAAVADLFQPDEARLDDRTRVAIRQALARLVGGIEADLRRHAARLLAGGGHADAAEALTAGEDTTLATLTGTGVVRDAALMDELIARTRLALIEDALPVAATGADPRGLLGRLAALPDGVVAAAATALSAAQARGGAGPALPAELQHWLVWRVTAAIRAGLPTSPERDAALVEAARRGLAAHDEGERVEAAAERLAAAIDPSPTELPPLLVEALGDRRLALFVAVLARGLRIDGDLARALIVEPDDDRLWLALRAVGLSREDIAGVALALAEADRRRDIEAFADRLDAIAALEAAAARATLAPLTMPRDLRLAVRALARGAAMIEDPIAGVAGALVAQAELDGEGRLLSAEPMLDILNRRAGGDVGAPLAVAELAAIVRLARRLGVIVSRRVVVADEEGDLELWARVDPAGDRSTLSVSGWHERPGWTPAAATIGLPEGSDAGDGGWPWETDAGLRLTRLSIEAGRRLGFDAVALLGQPITALFTLDNDAGQLPLVEAFARREALVAQRARLRDGGAEMLLSADPRHDPAGGFAGFAGWARPVVPAAAPAAPALTEHFVAGLDRALRRPLAQIVANADSISGATDGPVAPDYADYAADIAHAGRHLLALVDDLVDLQAVERPDFAPAVDAIDLADVARRAAGLLAVRAGEAGVAIERPLPGAALWARGDFRRTLQIVVNLIGNAVRYAPRGSIVLVELRRDGGRAVLTIADEGKGIAATDQARIFEKFQRVDTSEPGGNGLGLYIARRLARAMNGDLTLASTPGEGARFTLALPADAPGEDDQR